MKTLEFEHNLFTLVFYITANTPQVFYGSEFDALTCSKAFEKHKLNRHKNRRKDVTYHWSVLSVRERQHLRYCIGKTSRF